VAIRFSFKHDIKPVKLYKLELQYCEKIGSDEIYWIMDVQATHEYQKKLHTYKNFQALILLQQLRDVLKKA